MHPWLRQHSAAIWPACALLVASAVTAVLWHKTNEWRDASEEHRATLARMAPLVAEYKALEARADEVRVAAPPGKAGLTSAALDRIVREQGLATRVQNMSEVSPREEAGILVRAITLRLSSITTKDLAQFLARAEELSPYVFTESLRITRNSRVRSRIDAKIRVSAYEELKDDST